MSVMTRQLVGPSVGFCLDGWFELSYFLKGRKVTHPTLLSEHLLTNVLLKRLKLFFLFIFNNFAVRLICCCSLLNIYPLTLAKINRNMLEIQTPPHVEVTRGVHTISAEYIFANIP